MYKRDVRSLLIVATPYQYIVVSFFGKEPCKNRALERTL